MNRAKLTAELSPQLVAALTALDTWDPAVAGDTWDACARAVCVQLGQRLLAVEGWHERQALLVTTPSAALRAVLPKLAMRRTWGASTVAFPLCQYFEAPNAYDDVRRRLGELLQTPTQSVA